MNPGFYVEGSHGIRLENELLVRTGEKMRMDNLCILDNLPIFPWIWMRLMLSPCHREDKEVAQRVS